MLSHQKIVIKPDYLITEIGNQNSSKTTLFNKFYDKIELFIKGLLYKQMDLIFKHISIESQKYPLIYNLKHDLNFYQARTQIKREKIFYKLLSKNQKKRKFPK